MELPESTDRFAATIAEIRNRLTELRGCGDYSVNISAKRPKGKRTLDKIVDISPVGRFFRSAAHDLEWAIGCLVDVAGNHAVLQEEVAELRATLDNEQGRGEPPVPGYVWDDGGDTWRRGEFGEPGSQFVTRHNRGNHWEIIPEILIDGVGHVSAETARAAMILCGKADQAKEGSK